MNSRDLFIALVIIFMVMGIFVLVGSLVAKQYKESCEPTCHTHDLQTYDSPDGIECRCITNDDGSLKTYIKR